MFDYKTVKSADFLSECELPYGNPMLTALSRLSVKELREVRARTHKDSSEKYLFEKSHELLLRKAEEFVLEKFKKLLLTDKKLLSHCQELELFLETQKLGELMRQVVLDAS